MRRFKITFFFKTPFYLCVLHIYHVTRVATLSVRILTPPGAVEVMTRPVVPPSCLFYEAAG